MQSQSLKFNNVFENHEPQKDRFTTEKTKAENFLIDCLANICFEIR